MRCESGFSHAHEHRRLCVSLHLHHRECRAVALVVTELGEHHGVAFQVKCCYADFKRTVFDTRTDEQRVIGALACRAAPKGCGSVMPYVESRANSSGLALAGHSGMQASTQTREQSFQQTELADHKGGSSSRRAQCAVPRVNIGTTGAHRGRDGGSKAGLCLLLLQRAVPR